MPHRQGRFAAVTLGAKETPQAAGDSTAADDRQWELFASAKTAEEFCRAWLALLFRQLGGVTAGPVLLQSGQTDNYVVSAVLRLLHWSVAWISDLFHRREVQDAGAKIERIGSVMEGVATALRQASLQQTLFEVANHLARHLRCSRVALGLTEGHSVKVAALSHAPWFEKKSSVVKRYAAAMEEALDKRENVAYRREDS